MSKCGKPAAPFIPRLGMSFSCVLEAGHDGDCKQGGNCFKHGEYIGSQCPQWPTCCEPLIVSHERAIELDLELHGYSNVAAAPLSAPPCKHEKVSYCRGHDNFYCDFCHRGMGDEYYKSHKKAKAEVASSPSPTDKRVVFEFRPGQIGCSACGDGDTDQKEHRHVYLEAKGEWVKVTPESLPPVDEEVWIYSPSIGRGMAGRLLKNGKWWASADMGVFGGQHVIDVTHWQKLPSPPEENRDE